MLAQPATLSDHLVIANLARGIPLDPKDRHKTKSRSRGAKVKVHGGEMTEDIQRMADQFHVNSMQGDWARSTGSSPAALKWALGD